MLTYGSTVKIKIYTSLVTSLLLISGCTTYHSAAAKGNIKAIDRLHAEGEDINIVDGSGVTALIHAINLNQKEGVIGLLNAGANVNACDEISKNTPLHHAILQSNLFLVRLLVDNGADVTLRNSEGKSPLDLIQYSHNEDIKRLVKAHSNTAQEVKKKDIQTVEAVKTVPIVKVYPVVKPEPDAISPVHVEVKPLVSSSIVEKKSPAISEADARAVLNRLMSKHETLAVRSFLNEHPEMISLISDPRQQLRYIGPAGWRVMDIAEALTRGVLKEKEIIDHIETSALPYKKFTEDEIRIISHYGISTKIINAMITVTH